MKLSSVLRAPWHVITSVLFMAAGCTDKTHEVLLPAKGGARYGVVQLYDYSGMTNAIQLNLNTAFISGEGVVAVGGPTEDQQVFFSVITGNGIRCYTEISGFNSVVRKIDQTGNAFSALLYSGSSRGYSQSCSEEWKSLPVESWQSNQTGYYVMNAVYQASLENNVYLAGATSHDTSFWIGRLNEQGEDEVMITFGMDKLINIVTLPGNRIGAYGVAKDKKDCILIVFNADLEKVQTIRVQPYNDDPEVVAKTSTGLAIYEPVVQDRTSVIVKFYDMIQDTLTTVSFPHPETNLTLIGLTERKEGGLFFMGWKNSLRIVLWAADDQGKALWHVLPALDEYKSLKPVGLKQISTGEIVLVGEAVLNEVIGDRNKVRPFVFRYRP